MSCKYCIEDRDGFVVPIEKNGHAFIFFGVHGYSLAMKACGRIASCLVAIRAQLGVIGFALLMMLLFKNMGGK